MRKGHTLESNYLKTLIEVVKTGSLSKAADILFVTQPAVSRRIKFLEDQYGCRLLDRSGQSVTTTDAGRIVFEKAEQMLAIEQELLYGLKSMREKKSIAFICTPTFGIVYLPAIMHEFMLEYNDLADLSFLFDTPDKILEALQNGMFDLAVIEHCECFDLSELTTFTLPGDSMIFVSSPKLEISEGEITLETLLAQTLFTRKEGCCSRTLLEGNLRALGKGLSDFKNFVVVDDLRMIVQGTLNGQGVSFLSREIVKDQINTGLLREHRIRGFQHDRSRTMIVHKGNDESPLTPLGHFIKIIKTHFGLSALPITA